MSERIKVRIKFSKHGALKYIGHLDIMRYFQKVFRRADIDIAYTEGFSPHQIMSFAAPLGVGMESRGEYMDIEVLSMNTAQEMKEALNRVMVEGVEILSVSILPDHAKNAMASVAAAAYTVRFREGKNPKADISALLPDFLSREQIPITKKTKKGTREVDLKEGIYRLSYEDGVFFMIVDASSGGNIKPVQIMEALLLQAGETLQENALAVTREEVYTQKKGENRLIPLDEIGFVS